MTSSQGNLNFGSLSKLQGNLGYLGTSTAQGLLSKTEPLHLWKNAPIRHGTRQHLGASRFFLRHIPILIFSILEHSPRAEAKFAGGGSSGGSDHGCRQAREGRGPGSDQGREGLTPREMRVIAKSAYDLKRKKKVRCIKETHQALQVGEATRHHDTVLLCENDFLST